MTAVTWPTASTTPTRVVRTVTLAIAPLIATAALERGRDAHLMRVMPVLAILWMIMACTMVARLVCEVRRPGPAPEGRRWPWDHLDVLTATGTAMMWGSAGALAAADVTGWASLSVLGVLGLSTVYLVVTWTSIVAGGATPWSSAMISRAILPATSVEGDPLREEVRMSGVRIPAGMRLFATGRATPHGVTTRYAVGAPGGRGEVKLEAELGPAVRGEHRAAPLALWLGDSLGLTRTPVTRHGAVAFSVLPRPGVVDGARKLLGNGGDAATARPAQHQPTEGTFRMREYVPGDDTRRIHWVRSLQANQLVVRLPDEVPPADPALRLVLDSELGGVEALSCHAPHQLLDALVQVWLGIAKALVGSGTRVTLVAAARTGADRFVAVERPMIARSPREGLRLGARVAWQTEVALDALLAPGVAQVVVSSRPRQLASAAKLSWVVVPESAWTPPEAWPPIKSAVTLAFPNGSADNRLGRRRREWRSSAQIWRDRATFGQVICWADWTAYSGHYLARPNRGRVSLAVIP